MDRYGTWIVKLEISQQDTERVMDLSKHVEKVLEVAINPPEKEVVFGRVVED
jgi:hypothetical protein